MRVNTSNKYASFLFLLLMSVSTVLAFNDENGVPKVAIRGRVVDQNKAVIVGAAVTIRSATGGRALAVTADDSGEFSIQIEPGDYDVTVKADGFAEQTARISIKAYETPTLEVALQLLPNTVTVEVTSPGEYQPSVTSSGTKTPTALRDIPQSINVIDARQISDQGLTNIGDTLRYSPGVMVHQGENNRDQVIIRGQSSSADFYLNGVRDDVQYYRDLYNLDAVEVVRGPNALVFGRGGGGGIVNRVTKEAVFAPVYAFTAQGGSFGNARGTFDVNTPLNSKFAFRVNGLAERADSFRDFVGRRRFGFTPTLTFAPDAKTRFTLTYEYARDRRTADRGITSYQNRPADVPRWTFYGNPDDSRVSLDANVVHGSFERQFGDLTVRNRVLFGDFDRFYQNYVPGAVNAAGTLVTLTAYNNRTRRRNFFDQTDLVYNLRTGRLKHTILGGVEVGRQRSNNFRNTGFFNNAATSVLVDFDGPQTEVPVTFRQSATDADNRVTVGLAAAYVQDQVEINRHLQIVAGVRYDHFDLKFHNNRSGGELRRVDRLVSPRFGVVVKPVETVSLYGSYSVSYLPSSGDQFASLTSVTEQVKPEKFENFEGGVKWDIASRLSFTSAVFRLERSNTRSTDPNNPAVIIQTGRQRTNGMELSLAGRVTRNWSLTGGYSYQDAEIVNATAAAPAGRQVPQVPHHSFTVWNKYQLTSRLSGGLGLISRSGVFAAIDNTVRLPGYTRADAAVFYTISEHWRLQANIENLFNTRYYLNADNNTNISFGSPIAAKVSLSARF